MNCQIEMWVKICRICSRKDLESFSQTCKIFKTIARGVLSETIPLNLGKWDLPDIEKYMNNVYCGSSIPLAVDEYQLLVKRLVRFVDVTYNIDEAKKTLALIDRWDNIKFRVVQHIFDLLNINSHIWFVSDPPKPFKFPTIAGFFATFLFKLKEYEEFCGVPNSSLRKKIETLLVLKKDSK